FRSQMNVWLIKDGENLPLQPDARRMRTWMLGEALAEQGHQVTWWASTHSHQRKSLFFREDREVDIAPRFRLKLLHAGSYRRNKSIARLLHHSRLAAKFREIAPTLPAPGIIVSAFPTIELAFEAVAFAKPRAIPVIVDIRDPWPDSIIDHARKPLRAIARIAFRSLDRKTKACFVGADSLVACSSGFLDWGMDKSGRERQPVDRVFYIGSTRPPATPPAASKRIEELSKRLAGKRVFSFVGSFGHVYQLRLVCEAAAILRKRGPRDVHFVLAGDGQQYPRVAEAAQALDNLTATGWLSARDVDRLMSFSHVGLAPIRQMPGCVPNKIFEYSAAGLPILSSLEGETGEILAQHRAGLTYAPEDREAFLSLVTRLASDEHLRREMAQNSAAMFEREFCAARIYDEYVHHVESIARARKH
ncbi:MAG: glycosyltransferase family 4 protein, partial [Pseudomonadota bacterium]|nr:glycosyltransferase family 4 protein [Pseudomonadota bacterium]